MAYPRAVVTGHLQQPSLRLVVNRSGAGEVPIPERAKAYPELRYMGSKYRLLPWIHGVLSALDFESAADPFLGSGCVAHLLKCMDKRVVGSDFLNFSDRDCQGCDREQRLSARRPGNDETAAADPRRSLHRNNLRWDLLHPG